jgi:serine/threonine protein phosphatase PrpC
MSPQLAISFVRRHLSREKDVTEAAQAVAQEALRRGSIDNVTVLILTFNIGIQQS